MSNKEMHDLINWIVYPENFPKFLGKAYKINGEMLEKHKDCVLNSLKETSKAYEESLIEIGESEDFLPNDFKESVDEYEKTNNIELLEDYIVTIITECIYDDLSECLNDIPIKILNCVVEDVTELAQQIVYEIGFKTFCEGKETFWVETFDRIRKKFQQENIYLSLESRLG